MPYVSRETVNLKSEVSDPFPYSGSNRESIVAGVVWEGMRNVNGSICAESKAKIYRFFKDNQPTQHEFADFLNRFYAPHGYSPVCLSEHVSPYTPYDMVYNDAGLQFLFRDQNRNIHIECLPWNEVARRIGKMIRDNEYLQEKPPDLQRKSKSKEAR